MFLYPIWKYDFAILLIFWWITRLCSQNHIDIVYDVMSLHLSLYRWSTPLHHIKYLLRSITLPWEIESFYIYKNKLLVVLYHKINHFLNQTSLNVHNCCKFKRVFLIKNVSISMNFIFSFAVDGICPRIGHLLLLVIR